MKKVLILGGYGNFGKRIAIALGKANIPTIIAGREKHKAESLAKKIKKQFPTAHIEISTFDAYQSLDHELEKLKPFVVINTIGPFQTSDYSIPKICIQHKIHYLDLADGRDFVSNIVSLNDEAKKNNVLVVSGASTVPGLSSAVIEHYKNQFSEIESLVYGISPGQNTESRGFATAKSILTYLGKPLKPIGNQKIIYGWQDLYLQEYPILGKRWMANCDIPDLDIFPRKYGIQQIHFSAGIESTFLHLGMWLVSYLVRLGLPLNLPKHTQLLLNFSHLFNRFGSHDGGMHVLLKGKDKAGNDKEIKWFVIATNNDGPQIPCVPAIVLTKKLVSGSLHYDGAIPCVGLVTLKEYMDELKSFSIQQIEL